MVSSGPHRAALNRHPFCAHIGKFDPREIGDRAEQEDKFDRDTPTPNIPHGPDPCRTASKVLLL
jgi:hypothetical protein